MKNQSPSIANIRYLEEVWRLYENDPSSVSSQWRELFEEIAEQRPELPGKPVSLGVGREQLHRQYGPGGRACEGCGRAEAMSFLQYNVSLLVRNYRVRGHLLAKCNPLESPHSFLAELEPEYYGMSQDDLDLLFNFGHKANQEALPLRKIIEILQQTYTDDIGVQFMHIDNLDEREWLQDRMESGRNKIQLSKDQQIRILERLTDAVVFERFVQKKFVGAKSFSLEGAETLIPLLIGRLPALVPPRMSLRKKTFPSGHLLLILRVMGGLWHSMKLMAWSRSSPTRKQIVFWGSI